MILAAGLWLGRHAGKKVHPPSTEELAQEERRGQCERDTSNPYRHSLIARHAILSLSVRGSRWLGTTSSTTLSSHPLCGQVSGREPNPDVCLARAVSCVWGIAVVERRIWYCCTPRCLVAVDWYGDDARRERKSRSWSRGSLYGARRRWAMAQMGIGWSTSRWRRSLSCRPIWRASRRALIYTT